VSAGDLAREAEVLLARLAAASVETESHTRRVADLMRRACSRLALPAERSDAFFYGALLHDIGKLYVPPEILHKPGPLTDEERAEMRIHPSAGAIIADQWGFARETSEVILHHHEMFAGGGYPGGMAGEEIPLGARLFSVVDAYDAVVSDRCYRRARSADAAIGVLRSNSGRQFDPALVEIFISACVR
jgi:putative two-component system response regulator